MAEKLKAELICVFVPVARVQKRHGHCKVPGSCNNKLVRWVMTQRSAYRKGKLQEPKIKALNKIGFVWNPRNKS